MSIQKETLDCLSSKDPFDEDIILSADQEDWIDVIDNDVLDKNEKLKLLDVIANKTSWADVIIRLSNQSAFGIVIAREIMSDKRWNEITEVIEQSGFSNSKTDREKEKAISFIVTKKSTFFWFFRILFSKSFLKAMKGIVYDGESELRLKAIEILSEHDGDNVYAALIGALDDTDKKVRQKAEELLREKYGDDEINKVIASDAKIMDELRGAASNANEWFSSMFLKIPGLLSVTTMVGEISSSLVDKTKNSLDSISKGVSGLTDKFTRKTKDNSDS